MKAFSDLTEQEILALAISSEEDDSRTYIGLRPRAHGQVPGFRQGFHRDGRGGA